VSVPTTNYVLVLMSKLGYIVEKEQVFLVENYSLPHHVETPILGIFREPCGACERGRYVDPTAVDNIGVDSRLQSESHYRKRMKCDSNEHFIQSSSVIFSFFISKSIHFTCLFSPLCLFASPPLDSKTC
jgi:hypothetical protein